MSEPNIQNLFKSIGLEQIRKYLTELGWQEKETEVRRQFEKLDPESQSMRTLILPLQESHPRFRSMVPNIVFSLAVEHQREAMEIAIDISKTQVSEPVPQQSPSPPASAIQAPPRPFQLEITNSGGNSIQLVLSGERPIVLAPSEAAFLSLVPGSQPLVLETQSDLNLTTANHAVVGKSLGFPSDAPALANAESIAEYLLANLDGWNSSQPAVDVLRAELIELADRYLFSIDGTAGSPPDSSGLLRGLAVLLASISKKLEPSPKSTAQLFLLCRILLRPFGYTFPMNPLLPDQLWITLRADDAGAPRKSLQFLQQNVVRW